MSGDQMMALLVALRDTLRRLDPAWCALNGRPQVSDEELDDMIGRLEEEMENISETV